MSAELRLVLSLLLICLLPLRARSGSRNLLINPSAESAANQNTLEGWTVTAGTAGWTGMYDNPANPKYVVPVDGTYYFTPPANSVIGYPSEIQQVVSLPNFGRSVSYRVYGHLNTITTTYYDDYVSFLIQFTNTTGNVVNNFWLGQYLRSGDNIFLAMNLTTPCMPAGTNKATYVIQCLHYLGERNNAVVDLVGIEVEQIACGNSIDVFDRCAYEGSEACKLNGTLCRNEDTSGMYVCYDPPPSSTSPSTPTPTPTPTPSSVPPPTPTPIPELTPSATTLSPTVMPTPTREPSPIPEDTEEVAEPGFTLSGSLSTGASIAILVVAIVFALGIISGIIFLALFLKKKRSGGAAASGGDFFMDVGK